MRLGMRMFVRVICCMFNSFFYFPLLCNPSFTIWTKKCRESNPGGYNGEFLGSIH